MRYLICAMLAVAGIIHLLPVTGVAGPERLADLYGVAIAGPDLGILMRHRAVVLATLGAFMLFAAFRPNLQRAAVAVGLLSAVSFLWLAWSTGGYNEKIARVFVADVVATLCLLVAALVLCLPASRADTKVSHRG